MLEGWMFGVTGLREDVLVIFMRFMWGSVTLALTRSFGTLAFPSLSWKVGLRRFGDTQVHDCHPWWFRCHN
jgi:hypothetical protein